MRGQIDVVGVRAHCSRDKKAGGVSANDGGALGVKMDNFRREQARRFNLADLTTRGCAGNEGVVELIKEEDELRSIVLANRLREENKVTLKRYLGTQLAESWGVGSLRIWIPRFVSIPLVVRKLK